jgi:hypothetical protein
MTEDRYLLLMAIALIKKEARPNQTEQEIMIAIRNLAEITKQATKKSEQ